jgi:hypothetical protein
MVIIPLLAVIAAAILTAIFAGTIVTVWIGCALLTVFVISLFIPVRTQSGALAHAFLLVIPSLVGGFVFMIAAWFRHLADLSQLGG